MNKKFILLPAAMLLLAACGGAASSEASSTPASSTTPSSATPSSAALDSNLYTVVGAFQGWDPLDEDTVMTRATGTNNFSLTLDLYVDTQWKLVINQSWDAGQVSPSSPGVTVQENGTAVADFLTAGGTNMAAVGDGFDGYNFNTKVHGNYTINFTSLPALSRVLNIVRNGDPIVPPPTNIDWYIVGSFTDPTWGDGFVPANLFTETSTPGTYEKTLDLLEGYEFKIVKMVGTTPTWNGTSILGTVTPAEYDDAVGGSDNFVVATNGNYKLTLIDGETDVLNVERLSDPIVAPPVVPYPLPQWRVFKNDWEGSAATHEGVEGELVMTVQNANFSQGWQLQVIQDAFALGTGADNVGHMQLEAGKTYRVSLDAKSSIAGDIKLAIGHAGGGWTPYHEATLAVTNDVQTLTSEFTLDASGDFSIAAQFKLEMGLLFAGATAGSSFTLDNVKIEEKVGDDYNATDLIVNGTMDKLAVDPAEWFLVGSVTEPNWDPANKTLLLTAVTGQTGVYEITLDLVLNQEFKVKTGGSWSEGKDFGFDTVSDFPVGAFENAGGNIKVLVAGNYTVTFTFIPVGANITGSIAITSNTPAA
jgi:hypothetical protein